MDDTLAATQCKSVYLTTERGEASDRTSLQSALRWKSTAVLLVRAVNGSDEAVTLISEVCDR